MATIGVAFGGDWKQTFKIFEMKFFGISEADWPEKFFEKIKDISPIYDPQRHAIHVDSLNQLFKLSPPLTTDDFDKKSTLQEVQDEGVEPRLPTTSSELMKLNLSASEEELHAAGLSHLLEGGE